MYRECKNQIRESECERIKNVGRKQEIKNKAWFRDIEGEGKGTGQLRRKNRIEENDP